MECHKGYFCSLTVTSVGRLQLIPNISIDLDSKIHSKQPLKRKVSTGLIQDMLQKHLGMRENAVLSIQMYTLRKNR